MKHIKINDTVKSTLIENFKKYLNNAKLTESNLNYTADIDNTVDKTKYPRAQLYISAIAYLKMMLYVRDTSTEIAWHGTVKRHGKNIFQITDVMLYPQTVTGATVNTDQDKYNEWIQDLDDDTHCSMRFQGHSHVNFGVTPSGTDMSFYNDILQVLPNDDYYIFMIMNKSGNTTFLIYDLAENIIYENPDIDYSIINDTTPDTFNLKKGFTEILDEINNQKEEYCKAPVYNPPTYSQHYNYGGNIYHKELTQNKPNIIVPRTPHISFNDDDDDYTGVNSLLDDIDKKFKNATLKSKKRSKSK